MHSFRRYSSEGGLPCNTHSYTWIQLNQLWDWEKPSVPADLHPLLNASSSDFTLRSLTDSDASINPEHNGPVEAGNHWCLLSAHVSSQRRASLTGFPGYPGWPGRPGNPSWPRKPLGPAGPMWPMSPFFPSGPLWPESPVIPVWRHRRDKRGEKKLTKEEINHYYCYWHIMIVTYLLRNIPRYCLSSVGRHMCKVFLYSELFSILRVYSFFIFPKPRAVWRLVCLLRRKFPNNNCTAVNQIVQQDIKRVNIKMNLSSDDVLHMWRRLDLHILWSAHSSL